MQCHHDWAGTGCASAAPATPTTRLGLSSRLRAGAACSCGSRPTTIFCDTDPWIVSSRTYEGSWRWTRSSVCFWPNWWSWSRWTRGSTHSVSPAVHLKSTTLGYLFSWNAIKQTQHWINYTRFVSVITRFHPIAHTIVSHSGSTTTYTRSRCFSQCWIQAMYGLHCQHWTI